MGNRIMAAMSGGVDSSVAALLLKEKHSDICGATLKLYSKDDESDIKDARRVCERLGIEHYTLDMQEQFRKMVIERFAKVYCEGQTPNPCIECNRSVKFSGMLRLAEEKGFDSIATGHYVRREYDAINHRWQLKRAAYIEKDQSYVLYVLDQRTISRTFFPLGQLSKEQVRDIAAQNGFENADKGDSQDICFIPDGDYAGFLISKLGVKTQKGSFVDANGRILGEHKGMIHYTLGQRRGLGVSAGERLFVAEKRLNKNEIVLGGEELLFERRMKVNDINWVSIDPPERHIRAWVKPRYRHPPQPAWVTPIDEQSAVIEFDEPQRALTPGQAAVFYDDEMLLGGGTILPKE